MSVQKLTSGVRYLAKSMILWAAVVLCTASNLSAQEERRLNASDFQSPGKVVIMQEYLSDDGAKIDLQRPRTGEQAFANAVEEIISTWRPHGFSDGTIRYTVSIAGGNTRPLLSLNLEACNLKNESDERKERFRASFENTRTDLRVQITSPPSGIIDIMWWNLNLPFKIAFVALTILWLIFVIWNGLKIWGAVAPPNGKGSPAPVVDEKTLERNFKSTDAVQVQKMWMRAMALSSLEGPFLSKEKLGVGRPEIRRFAEDVSACNNEDELRELLSNGVSDSLPEAADVLAAASPGEGKAKVTEFLTDIQEIDSILEDKQKWFALSPEQEKAISKKMWYYFGEPNIKKARDICHAANKSNGDEGYTLFEVYESGLQNHLINQNNWWASQEIDRAIDRTSVIKIDESGSMIDSLWAFAGIFPMVGLLGTVVGISSAFGEIKDKPPQELMTELAGHINVALSTTIDGIILGLASVAIYYFFKSRMDTRADSLERYFINITNKA